MAIGWQLANEQWGYHACSSAKKETVTFPVSFSSACYSCVVGDLCATASRSCDWTNVVAAVPTKTEVTFAFDSTHTGIYWIAIGK